MPRDEFHIMFAIHSPAACTNLDEVNDIAFSHFTSLKKQKPPKVAFNLIAPSRLMYLAWRQSHGRT